MQRNSKRGQANSKKDNVTWKALVIHYIEVLNGQTGQLQLSKPNSTISDVVMQQANMDGLTVRSVHGVNVARFRSSIRRTDSTVGTATIIRSVA